MFDLQLEYFKNETVHKNIGGNMDNGILSCGYLNKKISTNNDKNINFNYYGALLILSGEGIHIDNEKREYKLYPGCFVQRIPGKLHSTYVKPDGQWVEFFICFGRELYEALSNINILDKNQDVLYPGVNLAILDTFNNFINSMKKASEEELPLLLIEAQKIILTIYQMHMKNTVKNESRRTIEVACQFINENICNRLSIHELSKNLDIGYEKFRKLFKSQMGISPGEFIIQSRINNAKSILIDTDKSIKEIAIQLDFPDTFTFSKQFKKMVGLSPSEFKKRY